MPDRSPALELEPFPIDEDELVARYENVFTAAVYDTLIKDHGIFSVLPTNLKPLVDGMKVCGIAFTVKGMPDCGPRTLSAGKVHERRARMIEEMYPHAIVVWDSSHDVDNAQFGEMMTATSMTRGATGAVIDGGIRDTDRILETGFRIWSRYRTPASMSQRHEIADWQIAVKLGEVIVNPGDIVFADMDGILTVPRGIAYEVLQKAEETQKAELGWREIIASGVKPSEYIEKGGAL